MTNEELDAIEARANAATKGPWFDNSGRGVIADAGRTFTVAAAFCETQIPVYAADGVRSRGQALADRDFIVAARSDVPALIAELRAAREKLKAMEALATKWHAACDDGTWFADGYETEPGGLLSECAYEIEAALRDR